jgi:hypothetical protein
VLLDEELEEDSSEEGMGVEDEEVSFVPLEMGSAEAVLPDFLKVRDAAGGTPSTSTATLRGLPQGQALTGEQPALLRFEAATLPPISQLQR